MMLPTHALAGMLLALPLFWVAPEFAVLGVLAGLLGGIVPDLDLYRGHRKTLHFPVFYSVFAIGTLLVAAVTPTSVTIAIAFFLLGAAAHCVADIFGGGLELRPWEGRSNRAVFDHFRGRWIEPRRAVRYDGAPEDLGVTLLLAIPLVVMLDGGLQVLIGGIVGVATVYTLLRRTLADLAPTVVSMVPAGLGHHLPNRYASESESDTLVSGD